MHCVRSHLLLITVLSYGVTLGYAWSTISTLPLKSINNIRTISQESIKVSIIPNHLLRGPWADGRGAVLYVNDIEAFEVSIDEVAPYTLVAVRISAPPENLMSRLQKDVPIHTSEKQRRRLRLLQIKPKRRLRTPETGQSIYS